METLTGKDTLHDTVGIAYQDEIESLLKVPAVNAAGPSVELLSVHWCCVVMGGCNVDPPRRCNVGGCNVAPPVLSSLNYRFVKQRCHIGEILVWCENNVIHLRLLGTLHHACTMITFFPWPPRTLPNVLYINVFPEPPGPSK